MTNAEQHDWISISPENIIYIWWFLKFPTMFLCSGQITRRISWRRMLSKLASARKIHTAFLNKDHNLYLDYRIKTLKKTRSTIKNGLNRPTWSNTFSKGFKPSSFVLEICLYQTAEDSAKLIKWLHHQIFLTWTWNELDKNWPEPKMTWLKHEQIFFWPIILSSWQQTWIRPKLTWNSTNWTWCNPKYCWPQPELNDKFDWSICRHPHNGLPK